MTKGHIIIIVIIHPFVFHFQLDAVASSFFYDSPTRVTTRRLSSSLLLCFTAESLRIRGYNDSNHIRDSKNISHKCCCGQRTFLIRWHIQGHCKRKKRELTCSSAGPRKTGKKPFSPLLFWTRQPPSSRMIYCPASQKSKINRKESGRHS